MKRFTAFALWLLVLCSIAGVIGGSWWLKGKHDEAGDGSAPTIGAAAAGAEEPMSAETRGLLDLRVEPLVKAVWSPQLRALGHVLDPGSLVSLWTEHDMTAASLLASEADVERDRQLFAKGGSVSRGLLDQAEAVVATDRLKREAVLHRLRFEWGASWVGPQPEFMAELLAGTSSMVRAEIASSVPLKAPPAEGWLLIPGQETAPVTARKILPAASIDPRLQGSAWLLIIAGGPEIPAPGSAVTVVLRTDGEQKTGVLIPASAVVQFEGKDWVFLEDGERPGQFRRRLVRTDRPLAGGYFADEGFAAGESVVTTASAVLLARQTLEQTPAEE